MLERLSASAGMNVVIELTGGRKISGTLLEAGRQFVRIETDDGVGNFPIHNILIIWEHMERNLTEEKMEQVARLLRDGEPSLHRECPGPAGFTCQHRYDCVPPHYCAARFSCLAVFTSPQVPCTYRFTPQCGPYQFQHPCGHRYREECGYPFYHSCGYRYREECGYPFHHSCGYPFHHPCGYRYQECGAPFGHPYGYPYQAWCGTYPFQQPCAYMYACAAYPYSLQCYLPGGVYQCGYPYTGGAAPAPPYQPYAEDLPQASAAQDKGGVSQDKKEKDE